MPESIGSFVTDSDSGKPSVDAGAQSIGGNAGRINEPEIINGFEAESPTTERIAGSGDGTGKRKRGRPAGSRNNPTQGGAKESVRLESLKISDLLYSIHLMGAEISRRGVANNANVDSWPTITPS